MQVNYEPFIDRMIQKYEGSYGWDSGDSGGPTKYGITCFDLAEHQGKKMNSMTAWVPAVKAMTIDTAEEIYAKKYATACRFNELESGKDAVLLDYGVNSGPSRAVRVAQRLLDRPETGKFDGALVTAVNASDTQWFVDSVCDERLHFMKNIRGGAMWETFGRGWNARVTDLRSYCHALAKNAPTNENVDLSNVTTPKANNQDPNVATNITKGTGTVVTGLGGGGLIAGIPWPVLAGLAVLIVIGGVMYVMWKKTKANDADETVHLPLSVWPRNVSGFS